MYPYILQHKNQSFKTVFGGSDNQDEKLYRIEYNTSNVAQIGFHVMREWFANQCYQLTVGVR